MALTFDFLFYGHQVRQITIATGGIVYRLCLPLSSIRPFGAYQTGLCLPQTLRKSLTRDASMTYFVLFKAGQIFVEVKLFYFFPLILRPFFQYSSHSAPNQILVWHSSKFHIQNALKLLKHFILNTLSQINLFMLIGHTQILHALFTQLNE